MLNKFLIVLITTGFLFSACQKKEEENTPKNSTENLSGNTHKVIVEEVINVTEYSYLKVKEANKEFWMAVPKAEFSAGEILFYESSMEMKNFESKELNRTFESILFVDKIDKQLGAGSLNQPQKPVLTKENISVAPVEGGITIAQLYSKAGSFSGKVVRIKGKVTKFNSGIMKKNWVHIQDGTSTGENFDLTITTNDFVQTGETITFEGKIILNKDFGYGYSYKVLMEDAKVLKNL